MTPKIAHLTTVHSAHDARIFEKQCRSLSAAGYRVTLIAPGDRNGPVDGVAVRPVRVPRSRPERLTRTGHELFRAALNEEADLYHFHDPELIGVAWALKRRGKRVVYDVHEDLPQQILSKHWIPRLLRGSVSRASGTAEAWAARWLDGIVAATPTIAARFPENKTIALNNYPLLDRHAPPAGRPRGASSPTLVTYIGGICGERGIFDLARAVSWVDQHHDVRLALAGRFMPLELKQQLQSQPDWCRIDFRGWCNRQEIEELLRASSVGVVPLHPLQRFIESQPVKLFEYMAAGIPVVASDFPLWREIVAGSRCGLLFQPREPRSLGAAIKWLLDHPDEAGAMGRRGRAAVEQKYNWRVEEVKLLAFYQRLLHESPHDRRCPTAIHQGSDRQQGVRGAA